jgi:hypothetical protein
MPRSTGRARAASSAAPALKQKKHPEGCFSCLAVGQGLIRAALPPRLSPYGRRRFAPASTSLTRYVEPLRGPHLLPQP